MMKKSLPILALAALLFSCQKPDDSGSTTPASSAPTAITLTPSATALSVEAEGKAYDLTISAPARPKVEIPADGKAWISLKDGVFKDYKITVTLTIAANTTYDSRTSEITVSATGVPSLKLTVNQEGKEVVVDPTLPDNTAVALSTSLGLGWNMGNHFDAYYNGSWAGENEGYPSETAWQPHAATAALFQGVKNAGFTSVRIPISWLKMIGEAPEYKIDETWMNRVYEVVQWAHDAGLQVIINTHHDENHGVSNTYQWLDIKNAATNETLNTTIKAEIKAVWTQIATKFADCGDWLIMESFNELNDGGWGWSDAFRANPAKQCNILNDWNQVFVDAVRATGGNNATRWLGVPTYAASPSFEQYWKKPTDPAGKIMLSVHFYDPSDYTIGDAQYSDWGHTGAEGKKSSGGDEDHVKEVFNNLYTNYVAKDVPVYIGEFGCSMRAKSDTRAWAFYKYYMEYVVKAAKVFGMPCFLWDNGADGTGKEQHGYINHGTGETIGNSKEVIDVMVKARFNTDPTYTLQSVYDSAPQF